MRCLYCNKKLSLLKLAKGDDFCSSEHFDAYQLQQSKDAIQRLMSAPDKEGPKAPLVMKKTEERAQKDLPSAATIVNEAQDKEQPRREVDLREIARQEQAPPAAIADQAQETKQPRREIDLREAARQEQAPSAPANPPVEQAPPYALFIVESLPALETKPPAPVAGELDPDPSFGRELSFPIQEIATTACLLNLHARLSPVETPPLNWTSPRNFILAAGDFPREVVPPSFLFSPDFPEFENSEPVEAVEPVAPAAPAQPRIPFLVPPSFMERSTPLAAVDADGSLPNSPVLGPILDRGLSRFDLTIAVARPSSFAGTTSPKTQNLIALPIESAPEFSHFLSAVFPAGEKTRPEGLLSSSGLIGITSAVFEARGLTALNSSEPIAQSLLIQPAAGLPDRAEPLDDHARITRTILPLLGNETSRSEPLPEHTGNAAPISLGVHLLESPAIDIGSLFPATAEMHSFGQEPAFTDPSVSAMEPVLRPSLAKLPASERLSTAAWTQRTPHQPLPASLADSVPSRIASLPMVPCLIPERLHRSADPLDPRSLAVHDLQSKTKFSPFPLMAQRTPDASGPVLAELNSRSFVSTSFPETAPRRTDHGQVGLCLPSVRWEPCFSADAAPQAVKFLPHREDPVRPSAGHWTPLTSLHRQ